MFGIGAMPLEHAIGGTTKGMLAVPSALDPPANVDSLEAPAHARTADAYPNCSNSLLTVHAALQFVRLFRGGNVKKRLLFVLAVLLVLGLVFASPAFAGKTTYWPGGTKLSFVPDEYGHIDVVYPACVTSVETYKWDVYDPDGTWIAGSNTASPSGQFTPTISGRYKVVVRAMIWPDAVDTLRGAYRYTAP